MLKNVETLKPRELFLAFSFHILGNLFTHHNDTDYVTFCSTFFIWIRAFIYSVKKYILMDI